jgi:D-alanine-D-alanine ligase
MIKYLKKIVKKVIPIEAGEKAYFELFKRKGEIDLCFNYAFGIRGRDKYAHIPAILEMLGIAYTGSGPLTQAMVLNKWKMKYFLKYNDVPTLPFNIYFQEKIRNHDVFKFPVIVKPIAQGSSAGITDESVVHDEISLKKQINKVYKIFKQPVLVEPFLEGNEYSIPLIGNPPRILSVIEPDYSKLPKGYKHLDSLEVKWIFEEESENNHLVCPAKISEALKKKLKEICLRTWNVLEIKDIARIDIRLDGQGNPFVLDVNTPPGLIPPEVSTTSYFPMAWRKTGGTYQGLLEKIIKLALERKRIDERMG